MGIMRGACDEPKRRLGENQDKGRASKKKVFKMKGTREPPRLEENATESDQRERREIFFMRGNFWLLFVPEK